MITLFKLGVAKSLSAESSFRLDVIKLHETLDPPSRMCFKIGDWDSLFLVAITIGLNGLCVIP